MKVPTVQLMRDAVRQGVGVSGKGAPETCRASQEILRALGRLTISDLGGRVQGGPQRSGSSRVDGREGLARIKNGGCAPQAAPGLLEALQTGNGDASEAAGGPTHVSLVRGPDGGAGGSGPAKELDGVRRAGGHYWPGKVVRPDAVPV